ncbi:hypothetical protein ACVW0P_000084 [Mucilaginibacter sp. UYNi724]
MNRNDILKFIEDNQGERILDYYEKCYEKIKELNKRSDQLTIYGIVIVVIYYVSLYSKLDGFDLGPFKISDLSFFKKVSAPMFMYVFFEWCILAYHRSDLTKMIKFISLMLYTQKIDKDDLNNAYFNANLRRLLPFSVLMDLNSATGVDKGKTGLIYLPFLILPFLPFWGLYVMIKNSIISYGWDSLSVISILVTLYIIACLIYFYYNVAKRVIKEQKEDDLSL